MRAKCWLPILALTSTMFGQATPAGRHSRVFGTYSSLITDSQDIGGTELTILPQFSTAYVIFQCAAGDVWAPAFVPATVTANTVDFVVPKIPNVPCDGTYHGVLTAKGIRLKNGDAVEFIPRRKSYWAR